jgi:lysophospholipid acyltransferase (LPLAT)-like uncharacterized protein
MEFNIKYKIVVLLLDVISKTWRIKVIGQLPNSPSIVVFWHGFMLPVWKLFSKKNPVGVVSQSKDGQILSDLLGKWNFDLIRGSSSKDGKEVLASIVQNASKRIVLMTPDGPRGPKNIFKAGAVIASIRSNSPIVFCGVNISCKKIFTKSWDSFVLPLPFSKITISLSEPLQIKNDLDRIEIDNMINICGTKLNMVQNNPLEKL